MDQVAAYFGYVVAALTVADKLLDAARAFAAATPGKSDDQAVEKAATWLDYAHRAVSYLAVAKGKA